MTDIEKILTEAERAEWRKMIAATAGMDATTTDQGKALIAELVTRESNGEQWAGWVLRELAARAGRSEIKRWVKTHHRVLMGHNGRTLNRAGAYSVPREDEAGYQTRLWHEMTWDQLRSVIDAEVRRLAGARDNLTVARRFLELQDLAPDTATPAEALAELGLSVDEWLTEDTA